MLKVTIRNNIKFPKLALQEYLEEVAERIIIPDIQQGIDEGRSVFGTPLPPNEPSTEKRKGHTRQLIGKTGDLRKSFFCKVLSKDRVSISMDAVRKAIGGYLQEGIVAKGKLKQYIFFGVSKNAETRSVKYVESRIIEAIKNGSNKG